MISLSCQLSNTHHFAENTPSCLCYVRVVGVKSGVCSVYLCEFLLLPERERSGEIVKECDKALGAWVCVFESGGGCILQFCLWHKQTAWLLPLLVVWVFCACVSLTASVICAFSSPGFAYPWQTLCTFLFVCNNWCSLTWINRETTDVATLAAIINTANVGRWFW